MLVGPNTMKQWAETFSILDSLAEEAAWGMQDYSDMMEEQFEEYKANLMEALGYLPLFEVPDELVEKLNRRNYV